MKVAVVGGRTILVIDDRIVDAAQASDGAIPAEPAAMFAAWPDLQRLTQDLKDPEFYPALDPAALDLPIPVPQQAFGIGVNYDGVPEVPDLHHRPERRGTHRVGRRIRPRTLSRISTSTATMRSASNSSNTGAVLSPNSSPRQAGEGHRYRASGQRVPATRAPTREPTSVRNPRKRGSWLTAVHYSRARG